MAVNTVHAGPAPATSTTPLLFGKSIRLPGLPRPSAHGSSGALIAFEAHDDDTQHTCRLCDAKFQPVAEWVAYLGFRRDDDGFYAGDAMCPDCLVNPGKGLRASLRYALRRVDEEREAALAGDDKAVEALRAWGEAVAHISAALMDGVEADPVPLADVFAALLTRGKSEVAEDGDSSTAGAA